MPDTTRQVVQQAAQTGTPGLVDFLDFISRAAGASEGPDWGLSIIPHELERNRLRELQSASSLGEQAAYGGQDIPTQLQPSGGRLSQLMQTLGAGKPAPRALTPDEQSVATSAYAGVRDLLQKEKERRVKLVQSAYDTFGLEVAQRMADQYGVSDIFGSMPPTVGKGPNRLFRGKVALARLGQGEEAIRQRGQALGISEAYLGLAQEQQARAAREELLGHIEKSYAPQLEQYDKLIAQLQTRMKAGSTDQALVPKLQKQIDTINKLRLGLVQNKTLEKAPLVAATLRKYGIEPTPENIKALPEGLLETLHDMELSDQERQDKKTLKGLFGNTQSPSPFGGVER